MQNRQTDQILGLLKQYRGRMLAHDTLAWVQNYLWIAAAAMLVLQIIGRIWPISKLLTLTLIPPGVFLLAAAAYLIFIPKSNLSVAWRVDQDLGLKERVSSLIAFEKSTPHNFPESADLFEKQREDALSTLKGKNPRSSFKYVPSRRQLMIPALIFTAAIVLAYLPNPMDEVLKTREAVSLAAEEQAEKIDELIEEIESNEQLTEEAKEALLQELEALAAQLRENQGDRAEALEDISRLEQTLSARLDPDAQFRQAATESISQQLAALAKQTAAPTEDPGDLGESLEALANEIGEMSAAEGQQLSLNLLKMAGQAAQAGATSLADALSALSQAAQTGSIEGAQQAGDQIQQALNANRTQLSDQQSLASSLAQLQNSRQAISQAGQPGTAAQNPGSGQQGQGQNPSQGQGQGQGNTVGGGGGSNANNLPPATSSGQAQNPQSTASSGAAGTLADQVFAPWERMRGENDPLSISGQDTGQGQTQVNEQDQPLPGINNPSIVPYQEVFQTYQNTAYETIEESYIPPSLKAYVLEYFSQLEP